MPISFTPVDHLSAYNVPSKIRQRAAKASPAEKEAPATPVAPSPTALAKAEDRGSNVLLEASRTLLLIFIMSSALSYFVTREDIFWGMKRPQWTRPEVIKTWMVSFAFPKLFSHSAKS
jgi:hypothetical protein